MTLYDDELAKLARTPQAILEVAVPYCANHYASGQKINDVRKTEEFEDPIWLKSGVTVTPDAAVDPLGNQTADRIDFALEGDSIRHESSFIAANLQYTGSFFLMAVSGSGFTTLVVTNTLATIEETKIRVALTETWARFDVFHSFGSGAGGVRVLKLLRDTGDLASVYAWGANGTLNSTELGSAQLYGYVKMDTPFFVFASKCQAVDQGDGKRCFYTFPTCQDRPNYFRNLDAPDGHLRVWKFCLKSAPLPLPGEDVLPSLETFDYAAQKIDPERAVTISDRITFRMADDQGPGIWDVVRFSERAAVNTQEETGSFWRRWLRIHQNYANPDSRVVLKVGFVAPGMTEAMFVRRFFGILRNIEIGSRGRVELICQDRLKLARKKVPEKISDSNLTREPMTASQTTLKVTDASELTQPGTGYTVTIQIDNEKMNVPSVDLLTNILTITRGRWGTIAATHATALKWSEVVELGTERSTITPQPQALGTNPIDAIHSLLNRSGIADANIDVTRLETERDLWLKTSVNIDTGFQSGPLYRRSVNEQTDVEKLIREIRDAYLIFIWVDEDQKVTGRVFAPEPPTVVLRELADDENLVADSVAIDDNQESRITRVRYAWDLSVGKSGDKIEDYGRGLLLVGGDEEGSEFYGDKRQRVVLNRGLQGFDDSVARQVGRRLLLRFRRGVRAVTCRVEIRDDPAQVGDFIALTTERLMDEHGNGVSGRLMMITQKKRLSESLLELEMLDAGLSLATFFAAPAGLPAWDNATPDQRRYGFAADSQGTVGERFEEAPRAW